MPAQFVVPAGQVQALFWQMRLPAQTWLQKPQCVLVFVRSAQVAAPVPALQRVKPDVHCTTHAPLLQSGIAAIPPPGQALPQAPQFMRLDSRSTQLPTPPPPPAHCV